MLRQTIAPFLFAACMAAPAFAQPADEREALEEEVDAGLVALDTLLSTGCGERCFCDAACETLGSVRRADERLGELDPAPRRRATRDKVERAVRRVRESCPACAVDEQLESHPIADKRERTADDADLDEEKAPEATSPGAVEQSAPPAPPPEAQRRGCASCTVGYARGLDGALWLGLGVAVFLGRRRRGWIRDDEHDARGSLLEGQRAVDSG